MEINNLTEEEQKALVGCLATYGPGDDAYVIMQALKRLDTFLANSEERINELEDELHDIGFRCRNEDALDNMGD